MAITNRRNLFALYAILFIGLSQSLFAEFVFVSPKGWIDLATIDNKDLSDEFRRVKESGIYAMLAVDPEDPGRCMMNAIVKEGEIHISPAFMDAVVEGMRKQVLMQPAIQDFEKKTSGQISGYSFEAKDTKVLKFGEVTVGRMVAETTVNGQHSVQAIYYLPGGNTYAVLSFATTAAKFPMQEHLFDEVARGTRGLKNAPPPGIDWQKIFGKAAGTGLLALLAGGVLVFTTWVQNRKATKKD